MNCNLLIASNGRSFLIDSIITRLEEAGIRCSLAEANVRALEKVKDKADRETVMEVMDLKPQGYLLKAMPKSEIVASIDRYFETSKWQNAASFIMQGAKDA